MYPLRNFPTYELFIFSETLHSTFFKTKHTKMAKTSFNDLIASEKPVLIDFYADWCGPCKAMAPILEELKEEVGDDARVVKINVDKNPNISEALQIRGIPTFMVFQNGDLKFRASGMMGKMQLKEAIFSEKNS